MKMRTVVIGPRMSTVARSIVSVLVELFLICN